MKDNKSAEPEMRPAIHDGNCEREVLAKILTDPYFGSMDKAMEILTPDCFHTPAHREIYQAALNVRNSGKDVDIINVSAELQRIGSKVGGAEVAEIACSGGAVHDITSYAARLRELRDLRSLQRLGLLIAEQASSGALPAAELAQKSIDTAGGILGGTSGGMTDMMEVLDEIVTHVDEVRSGKAAGTAGTPTGFREIDRRGGLAPTDLIVIAGGTSQGKTSLATSIAVNAMRAGRKVAFYSMEMDRRQICARILAEKTGASSRAILSGDLSDGQYERFTVAVADFPAAGLLCDDSSTSSLDSILASMRAMKAKYGIGGAVVDYLQILNVNTKSRNDSAEQILADAARRLKNIAKDLGIWVIALSQLNRNGTESQPPALSRLRSSGQIAEAADVVMLLWRPEAYGGSVRFPEPFDQCGTRGMAMVDVAKGRSMGTFRFLCGFDGETTRFYDVDRSDIPDFGVQDGTEAEEDPYTKY